MTRDQQIEAALALINPEDREQCRRRIETALDDIAGIEEVADTFRSRLYASKVTKAKVQSLRDVLDRVRVTHKNLPEQYKATVFKELDWRGYIAACDKILDLPSEPPGPRALRRFLAAAKAKHLLLSYGMKPTVTRGRRWHRLAAILYGDRKADLFVYLRQFKDRE
jgi:hypothetical protein